MVNWLHVMSSASLHPQIQVSSLVLYQANIFLILKAEIHQTHLDNLPTPKDCYHLHISLGQRQDSVGLTLTIYQTEHSNSYISCPFESSPSEFEAILLLSFLFRVTLPLSTSTALTYDPKFHDLISQIKNKFFLS